MKRRKGTVVTLFFTFTSTKSTVSTISTGYKRKNINFSWDSVESLSYENIFANSQKVA